MTTINPNSSIPTDPNVYGQQNTGGTDAAGKAGSDIPKTGSSPNIKIDLSSLIEAGKGGADAPVPNWAPSDVVWRNLGDLEAVIDSQQFDIQQLLAALIKFAASVAETTKNNRFQAALAAEALGLAAAQKTRDSADLQKAAGAVGFALSSASATVSIAGGLYAVGSVASPSSSSSPDVDVDVNSSNQIQTGGPDADLPDSLSNVTNNQPLEVDIDVDGTPPAGQTASTTGTNNQTEVDVEASVDKTATESLKPDALQEGGGETGVNSATQTEPTDVDLTEPEVENSATNQTTKQEVAEAQRSQTEDKATKRAETELAAQNAHFKNVKIDGELKLFQGVSTLLDGIGNFAKSQLEGDATIAQSESQRLNAQAETRKAVQQSENSYAEEWQQFQAKVLQLAEKVQDVQHRITERIYS